MHSSLSLSGQAKFVCGIIITPPEWSSMYIRIEVGRDNN